MAVGSVKEAGEGAEHRWAEDVVNGKSGDWRETGMAVKLPS